jgi:hypothetical protein
MFPQRIETTTGAGVPDIALIGQGKTMWCELKWETRFIRAEQFVWATRAARQGVHVNFLVGYPDKVEVFSVEGAEGFHKTKRYKLHNLQHTFPRKSENFETLRGSLR